MKTMIAAAMLLFAMAGGSEAQTAQQRYQGTFFVTAAAAACGGETSTAAVGDNYVFVFRTEANRQVIAIFGTRRAMSYAPSTDGRFSSSGTYKATSIGGGATALDFTGSYGGFAFTPKSFAATNPTVLLLGRLSSFDGVAGCTVSFTASGVRRPGF